LRVREARVLFRRFSAVSGYGSVHLEGHRAAMSVKSQWLCSDCQFGRRGGVAVFLEAREFFSSSITRVTMQGIRHGHRRGLISTFEILLSLRTTSNIFVPRATNHYTQLQKRQGRSIELERIESSEVWLEKGTSLLSVHLLHD
jgi:hypothetical protein